MWDVCHEPRSTSQNSKDYFYKNWRVGGGWNYPVRVVMDGGKEIAQESQTTETQHKNVNFMVLLFCHRLKILSIGYEGY